MTHTYRIAKDKTENKWVLFRVVGNEYTRLLSHAKRRKVMRIYKAVKYPKEPRP